MPPLKKTKKYVSSQTNVLHIASFRYIVGAHLKVNIKGGMDALKQLQAGDHYCHLF